MTKKKLYLLGLLTLLGFPFLGFIIHLFTAKTSFVSLFESNYNSIVEITIGVFIGWVMALLGWRIMRLDFMKIELNKYLYLFNRKDLSLSVIIFVSLSAGIGEEVFFRGVIQPFLGITITSIFFVIIHGYINPRNWRISIYGLYMTFCIMLIGYLSEEVGLITAIFSHTIIDLVLLLKMKKMLKL